MHEIVHPFVHLSRRIRWMPTDDLDYGELLNRNSATPNGSVDTSGRTLKAETPARSAVAILTGRR